MLNRCWITFLIFLILTGVLSCGPIARPVMHITGLQELRDPEWYFWGPGRLTEAGAVGNIPHKFERIDLVELIHKVTPQTANSYPVLPPCPELQGKIVGNIKRAYSDDPEDRCARKNLYTAYGKFQRSSATAAHRNVIQNEVIRASEQRCGVYKIHLRRLQSNANFLLGSAATALGGLGAIFTNVDTVRALAGSAGITSGIGAEFQESFFSSVIAPVIIDGMEARRSILRDEIMKKQSHGLSTYSLPNALADTARYIAACSVSEGIAEARKTVAISEFIRRDTGLKAMLQTFDSLRSTLPALVAEGEASETITLRVLAAAEIEAKNLKDQFISVLEEKERQSKGALKVKKEFSNANLKEVAVSAYYRMLVRIKNLNACETEGELSKNIIENETLLTLTLHDEEGQKRSAALAEARNKAKRLVLIDLEKWSNSYETGMVGARVKIATTDVTKDEFAPTVKTVLEATKTILNKILPEPEAPDNIEDHEAQCPKS